MRSEHPEPPVLQAEGLTRRFGAVTALDGVSLTIRRGGFFALLGPSGGGKSTLLRIIAGFEAPDAGSLSILGQPMLGLPAGRRPVNMMFQSYALFPHMSVFRNVAYGLEAEGLPRAEIRRRVGAMLERMQLSALAERRPGQLSGGQRQRVALARALIKQPQMLLLDEPLSALDRRLREEMQAELRRMQQEAGISFLIVTHDQEEALVLADRMAVLAGGRIMQEGPPAELYDRPANRFTAGFLGAMSFLPGLLEPGGAALRLAPGLVLQGVAMAPPVAGRWVAAIRPERWQILPAGSQLPEGCNVLPALVRDLAYHGAFQGLGVTLQAPAPPLPLTLTRSAGDAERLPLAIGDGLLLAVPHARTLLLPDDPP